MTPRQKSKLSGYVLDIIYGNQYQPATIQTLCNGHPPGNPISKKFADSIISSALSKSSPRSHYFAWTGIRMVLYKDSDIILLAHYQNFWLTTREKTGLFTVKQIVNIEREDINDGYHKGYYNLATYHQYMNWVNGTS